MFEALRNFIETLPLREAAVEIPIIALVVYLVLRMLHGTRGAGVFRGLVFVITITAIMVSLLITYLQLERVGFFLKGFLTTPALVLVILFQPELRRGLIRFGQAPLLRTLLSGEQAVFEQIADAAEQLSRQNIGALIAFQREVGLDDVIESGIRIDADVTSSLAMTIFWPDTPLSDGGVVIQNMRMVAAGCLFPLSENPNIDKRLGTRHRAAIGLTEDTDAVCVIVSEETGSISLAVGGQIMRNLEKDRLVSRLRHLLSGSTVKKPGGAQ